MCSLDWGSIVNLLGIIVNGFLAWWIVNSIQQKQNNERSIKDYFFEEIKDFRLESLNLLTLIYDEELNHSEILPSLKLLGIKSSHILNSLNSHFKIKKNYFNSYLIEMNKIITDDSNYIEFNNNNEKVKLTMHSRDALLKFQSRNQNKFNELIISVNESKYLYLKK